MTAVFADTSYYIALVEERDESHAAAVRLSSTLRASMITTSAVILELGAHFSHSSGRRSFLRLIELLRQANVEIVHVDPMLQGRGIGLFAARADKDWSLADCLSFLVMKDRGILESATSDEHFEQAGFIALLRQPSPNP